MKLAIVSTSILAMLTGAEGLTDSSQYKSLADCLSSCESHYSGYDLDDCRSNCRADEDWEQGGSGRDYRNRNNRNGRRRSGHRSYKCHGDDCYDLSEEEVVTTVIKGMVPIKDKQMLVGLDKDEDGSGGDSKDSGSKDSKEKDTSSKDSKEEDSSSKDSKEDDSGDSGKDDGDIDKGSGPTVEPGNPIDEPDDDKKKDKNDDDDDDKKDKEDDDDDDEKNRERSTVVVPDCETDGKNYQRCASPVASNDEDTCDKIEKEVCGKDMHNEDKEYCECIGLEKREKAATLIKGMVPIKDKQMLVGLDKDEDGSGGDSKDSGSKDSNEEDTSSKDSTEEDSSSKDSKEDDSGDSGKEDSDTDDDRKKDEDDDDDKKDKEDDDDDEKNRERSTVVVPDCETDGKNYQRCASPVASNDEDTCDQIEKEVCGKDMHNEDKEYCECIGLEKREAALRGALQSPF